MPGQVPNPVWLYRIVHIGNVNHILQNGLCARQHPSFDPQYINIGHPDIIGKRDITPVKIPGYGYIGEYVPFYLGKCSIMLYNILTGYGVPKQEPKDIIYILCSVTDVTANCPQYFFTDGQANTVSMTNHFNNTNDLSAVDWPVVTSTDFKKSFNDVDRPRRYQAEFLVRNFIPVNCINAIVVYNTAAKRIVDQLVVNNNLNIQVLVNPNRSYYFHF